MNIEFIVSLMTNRPLTTTFFIAVLIDVVFGVLRAIKQRVFNSSFGIDGAIRKVGMIFSVVFLFVVDYLLHFNLIGWMPAEVVKALGIKTIGLSSFFAVLFTIYECVSILKNMELLNIPLPKKIKDLLSKTLEQYTIETHEIKK